MARRSYFIKSCDDDDYSWLDGPAPESLARTVFEAEDVINTGVLDQKGNEIMSVGVIPKGIFTKRPPSPKGLSPKADNLTAQDLIKLAREENAKCQQIY